MPSPTLPSHDAAPGSVIEVSHEALVEGLARSAFVLVDVLPRESYRAGHIPGALGLPLAELRERAAAVLPDRSRPVVAYCGGFT